jgi:ABC-type transport system substrate-binding protein
MHKKFWFLVAAAVAVFALTGTAAATSGRQNLTSLQKAMAQTPQQRAANNTLNFVMEQDVGGFFALDIDETQFWAAVTGVVPEIRGSYLVDNKGNYHLDLASSVTVNSSGSTMTILIRPDAVWSTYANDGSVANTSPVTAADYAFTYNVIMDARNPVASTTGYSSIKPGGAGKSYTIVNPHKIVFHFATPFADYKDLFGYILPNDYLPSADALGASNGKAFNQVWRDCVCVQHVNDSGDIVDGNPVTDGPFYMDSYTTGQGVVLKRTANADWYGKFPALTQINFDCCQTGATEVNSLQGGQDDAAYPAPTAALAPLQNDPNFVYDVKNGFVQEHWDFNQANANLAHPWMRQAIALGMNRPAVIKAVYSDTNIAPGLKQLNNPEYEIGGNATGSNAYFSQWNYNQTQALTILKKHCTGGPTNASSNNTKIWTCPDGKASFDWESTTLAARKQSGLIFQAQLKEIGIDIQVHNSGILFSDILPGGLQGSCIDNSTSPPTAKSCGKDNWDIAEYAWVGGVDPSGFDAIYECYDTNGKGGQNYKNYCNITINNLQKKGDKTLTPSTRTSLYEKVAKIVSNKAYIVPLYARPVILVHNTAVSGMANSNNPTSAGPTWNVEQWGF